MAYEFIVDTDNTLETGLVSYRTFENTLVDYMVDIDYVYSYGSISYTTGKYDIGLLVEDDDRESGLDSYSFSNNLLMGDEDFTIAGWVKVDALNDIAFILSKGPNFLNVPQKWEYGIYLTKPADDCFITFSISSDGNWSSVTTVSSSAIVIDQWYFIVCIHDSVNNKMKISLNNGSFNEIDYSLGVGSSGSTTSALHLWMATAFWRDAVGYNGLGTYDEWGIWRKVLSTQEITDLYNNGDGNTLIYISPSISPSSSLSPSASESASVSPSASISLSVSPSSSESVSISPSSSASPSTSGPLYQEDVPFESGQTYKLSFRVTMDEVTRIQAYQGTQLIFDNNVLSISVHEDIIVAENISIATYSPYPVSEYETITVSENVSLTIS